MNGSRLDLRLAAGVALGILIGALVGLGTGFLVVADARSHVRAGEDERDQMAIAWMQDQDRLAQCAMVLRLGDVLAELEADNYGRARNAQVHAAEDLRLIDAFDAALALESVSLEPEDRRISGPELSEIYLSVRGLHEL